MAAKKPRLTKDQARIAQLEGEANDMREELSFLRGIEHNQEKIQVELNKARAAEKAAVYSATRLRRKIQHARAVIQSLLEILDTSEHPEG